MDRRLNGRKGGLQRFEVENRTANSLNQKPLYGQIYGPSERLPLESFFDPTYPPYLLGFTRLQIESRGRVASGASQTGNPHFWGHPSGSGGFILGQPKPALLLGARMAAHTDPFVQLLKLLIEQAGLVPSDGPDVVLYEGGGPVGHRHSQSVEPVVLH